MSARVETRRASFPWREGRPPHLPCGPGDVAAAVLLPGDPDRVELAAGLLEDVQDFGRRREFRVATGRFGGERITLCSTGIGGPSAEIAMVELANLGCRRAIRIGGMGALAETLPLGSFLVVDAAFGGTGTARAYGAGPEPVSASGRVVAALADAARRLSVPHAVGVVATTDSYYRAQGRALWSDADGGAERLSTFTAQGALGLDMESEALFAVGHALGLEVGAILAVHGHRATDEWLEDYEPAQRTLVALAATAMNILSREGEPA